MCCFLVAGSSFTHKVGALNFLLLGRFGVGVLSSRKLSDFQLSRRQYVRVLGRRN